MGKTTEFGSKLAGIANDFADLLNLDQHGLVRRRPVDEKYLYASTLIVAAPEIFLGNRIAGKAARDVARRGGKAGLLH